MKKLSPAYYIFLILLISCTRQETVSKSKYEDMKTKLTQLQDSIDDLKYYYHFKRIRPFVTIGDTSVTKNETYEFYAVVVADSLRIGEKALPLQPVASSSRDNPITIESDHFIHKMIYKPKKSGLDTVDLMFNFNPEAPASFHYHNYPYSIVFEVKEE